MSSFRSYIGIENTIYLGNKQHNLQYQISSGDIFTEVLVRRNIDVN